MSVYCSNTHPSRRYSVHMYTLTFWQCLLHLSHRKYFKCIMTPKLHAFMETYCAPYHSEHCYWTGMLLIVRVLVYLIVGAEPSGNPSIPLVATSVVVSFLLLLKGLFKRKVYKSLFVDAIESLFLFNLLALAVLALIRTGGNKMVVANISTTITLCLLVAAVAYHIYEYTPLHQKVHLPKNLTTKIQKPWKKSEQSVAVHNEDDRFHDICDLMDENDSASAYRLADNSQREPTSSVLELPLPQDQCISNEYPLNSSST